MKRCHVCGEEFESKYSFCPIDGNSLEPVKPPNHYEYRLTLISEKSLQQRLTAEAQFLFERGCLAWPKVKADPFAFALIHLRDRKGQLRQFITRPYVARASATAAAIVSLVVFAAFLLGGPRGGRGRTVQEDDDGLVPISTIDLRNETNPNSNPGVGAGKNGRVGFNKESGEGSGPKPARAQGGGSGGDLAQLPPSQGRLPQPSVIPAPIPTTYAKVSRTLPEAGINIDPVLWKDLPFRDYGDPRAKSTVPSNGPGNGSGVGTGQGPGIGEGDGAGFGPGHKRNMGGGNPNDGCCGSGGSPGNNPDKDIERIYRMPEVEVRARVLSKPEPQYTEEARRNQITGTVILSVVFSRNGQVTNIRAVQTLCCGLTEKAIAAARQIRFIPAMHKGQAASTYMQLEYNFNLY